MYGLISKLLISGNLKFEPGRITVFTNSFSLIDMFALKKMTDDAEAEGIKGISDLYFYGWAFGYHTTRKIIELLKLRKFEERYKITMDVIGLLGFGDYKTTSFKHAEHANFKVLGNPFAHQYYPGKKFVCHYIRGMEAGGGSLVHESHFDNIEFDCEAVNGSFCHHQNLSQENMDKVDKKLIKSQIDRPYVKKRQIEVIEEIGDDPSNIGL